MNRILVSSVILIFIVVFFSISRFGTTIGGFFKGDGTSLLEAASVLVGIWALIIGLGTAAIGAAFEFSKLPTRWKLRLFRKHIPKRIFSFLILALIAGVIPFIAIFSIDNNVSVHESSVTAWIILGFLLQIFLIFSAVKAAIRTYDDLSIIPAIKATLNDIDNKKVSKIIKMHTAAFQADLDEKRMEAIIPMSYWGRGLKGEDLDYHNDLLDIFITLFQNQDPQILDTGLRTLSEWIKSKNVADLDGYLQHRIIPACIYLLRTEQLTFTPTIFKTRLYFFTRLINMLYESGATLTGFNAGNPIWEMIEEYSNVVGMTNALEQSKMSLEILLVLEIRGNKPTTIFYNLPRSIKRLVNERSEKSIFWIDQVFEWYRQYLEFSIFRQWPNYRQNIQEVFLIIKDIYECVEKTYGDEKAIFAGIHDLRYWILVGLRRIQESFVSIINLKKLDKKNKINAANDFESFNALIENLIEIRRPEGNENSYKQVKFKTNWSEPIDLDRGHRK